MKNHEGIHQIILQAVLIVALLAPTLATAQIQRVVDQAALPAFKTYYSPEDYSAYHQIWAITSDDINRIYIGTAEGVSVFDNASWSLITTPSNTTVRSLSYGFRNQVYVGLQGDMGLISPDSSGILGYRSLVSDESDAPDFGNVWETHATPDGVYFQTSEYIVYWNGELIKWSKSEAGYHTSFRSQSGIIVREKTIGLVEFKNGVRTVIPHSEVFSDKRVFVMESIGMDKWLVGTRDNGFYHLSKDAVYKINTDIDRLVVDNWIYGGIRLADNIIGVYTLGAGLLVIDTNGNLVRSISMPMEISDRYVISAHLDRAGSIWLGTMNSGIERFNSNFLTTTVYDESLGIDGYIYDIQVERNKVVVSTGSGLHILSLSEVGDGVRNVQQFKKIDSVPIAWESSIVGDNIYAVSDAGVFRIEGERVDTLIRQQSFSIEAVSNELDILFIGGKSEINVLSINNDTGGVSPIMSIPVEGEVDHIEWDHTNRQLWANVKNTKIVSFIFDANFQEVQKISEHYYSASDSDVISLFELEGSRYYATSNSINKYNRSSGSFEPAMMCGYLCTDEIMGLDITGRDEIWVVYSDSVVSGAYENSGYRWITHNDLSFNRTSTGAIKYGSSDILYLAERSRLFRYDSKISPVQNGYDYSVVIKDVKPARTDTVYYGTYTDGYKGIGAHQPDYLVPEIAFDQRDINIIVTATNYGYTDGTMLQYRYKDRIDKTWIDIDDDNFTVSIPKEGKYTLEIRAIDEIGRTSRLTEYRLIVLPPWYRSWWAYIVYIVITALSVFIIHKYIMLRQTQRQAEEQAKELERERIVVRKLQEANERLVEANKLKDEFLATTSHELRTPLTAILGFTSVLKEEIPLDAEYREFLDIIADSGGRLMETLNSLLDLAKIRSGLMELSIERINLVEIAQETTASYIERAQAKGLYLRFETPKHYVAVEADSYALGRVISNLLSNGIKFTESGGITIKITPGDQETKLSVSDTGVGIDNSFIPRLFNAFMQESDGLARAYEGSGLGLAITGKFVTMMDAKLDVDSKKGVGSTFTLSFDHIIKNHDTHRPLRLNTTPELLR